MLLLQFHLSFTYVNGQVVSQQIICKQIVRILTLYHELLGEIKTSFGFFREFLILLFLGCIEFYYLLNCCFALSVAVNFKKKRNDNYLLTSIAEKSHNARVQKALRIFNGCIS